MSSVLKTILDIAQKISYFFLEYFYILLSFVMKFYKLQMLKWKKCSGHKELAKAQALLGSAVYSLHKQGQKDLMAHPSIIDQLRLVEDAESRLLQADDELENIEKTHESKKEAIKEKYAAKRTEVGRGESEGQ